MTDHYELEPSHYAHKSRQTTSLFATPPPPAHAHRVAHAVAAPPLLRRGI